jgi:hypothetical protein
MLGLALFAGSFPSQFSPWAHLYHVGAADASVRHVSFFVIFNLCMCVSSNGDDFDGFLSRVLVQHDHGHDDFPSTINYDKLASAVERLY